MLMRPCGGVQLHISPHAPLLWVARHPPRRSFGPPRDRRYTKPPERHATGVGGAAPASLCMRRTLTDGVSAATATIAPFESARCEARPGPWASAVLPFNLISTSRRSLRSGTVLRKAWAHMGQAAEAWNHCKRGGRNANTRAHNARAGALRICCLPNRPARPFAWCPPPRSSACGLSLPPCPVHQHPRLATSPAPLLDRRGHRTADATRVCRLPAHPWPAARLSTSLLARALACRSRAEARPPSRLGLRRTPDAT